MPRDSAGCSRRITEQVITHPHFPGKEKHLLRAMIADISADTILVPKGSAASGVLSVES